MEERGRSHPAPGLRVSCDHLLLGCAGSAAAEEGFPRRHCGLPSTRPERAREVPEHAPRARDKDVLR